MEKSFLKSKFFSNQLASIGHNTMEKVQQLKVLIVNLGGVNSAY